MGMDTRPHSLIGRLLRPRAESTLERLILSTYGGQVTASGQTVTPDRAMRASAVYTCVLVLSQSLAQLPLHLYRQTGRQKEFATDNPLYRMTHDRPNEWMTSYQFKELVMVHQLLRGNSVWLKTRDTRGRLRELIPISPDRLVGIQQDERYRLSYRVRRPGPGEVIDDIPGSAVVHFRYLSLDGVRGVSPIEYAREMIGLSLAMERHGATVFSSGAALGGILLYPGKLTDKAKKNLEESFNEKYTSIAGAHRTAVLEEGMKWEKVAMTAEDAQFLESMKFGRSQICGFFRVPAHLANDLEKATFSNIENLDIGFTKHTMTPLAVAFEQTLARDLLPEGTTDLYWKFAMEGLLRGDTASRTAYFNAGVLNGWLNANEARELDDRNPYPEGDTFRVPVNTAPASAAAAPAAPAQA